MKLLKLSPELLQLHPSAKNSIATVYYFNGEKCACKADAKLQYMTMQAPSSFLPNYTV